MVYPGAGSSIRFEKMREGIADYEKIKILTARAQRSPDPGIQKKILELQQHLQKFTIEREFKSDKLMNDLEIGRKLVEELSERLN
jgi:hypothetical protein